MGTDSIIERKILVSISLRKGEKNMITRVYREDKYREYHSSYSYEKEHLHAITKDIEKRHHRSEETYAPDTQIPFSHFSQSRKCTSERIFFKEKRQSKFPSEPLSPSWIERRDGQDGHESDTPENTSKEKYESFSTRKSRHYLDNTCGKSYGQEKGEWKNKSIDDEKEENLPLACESEDFSDGKSF